MIIDGSAAQRLEEQESLEDLETWMLDQDLSLGEIRDQLSRLRFSMDLAYLCVKHQMRLYVCHQMRLLNPQRSSLRSLTFARFARTFFNSLN